jgi:hypothetical protein
MPYLNQKLVVVMCTCHPKSCRRLKSGRSWLRLVQAKKFHLNGKKKLGMGVGAVIPAMTQSVK